MKNIIKYIIVYFSKTMKKNKSPTIFIGQIDSLPTSIKNIDKEIEKARRNLKTKLTQKF